MPNYLDQDVIPGGKFAERWDNLHVVINQRQVCRLKLPSSRRTLFKPVNATAHFLLGPHSNR
jgi:hypothetical protein